MKKNSALFLLLGLLSFNTESFGAAAPSGNEFYNYENFFQLYPELTRDGLSSPHF